MMPSPDSSTTPTRKRKHRKRSEGQAGSCPLVATGTPECEQKRKKLRLPSPAEDVRVKIEEEQWRDGQLDKTAENVPAKKTKKKKRDKCDEKERVKGQKKKRRDRDTCKVEKKRKNDKLCEQEIEGKPMSEEEGMEDAETEECLTATGAERVESLENDNLREQLIDELQEFIPDVRKRSEENISKLIKYDLQRFRSFRQQGKSSHAGPTPTLAHLYLLHRCVSALGAVLSGGKPADQTERPGLPVSDGHQLGRSAALSSPI